MRHLLLGTLISILLLAGAACQPVITPTPSIYPPVPTVVEPGLAHGEPCSPPCWQGLKPGKSTSADVAETINQVKASGWAKSVTLFPRGGFAAHPSSNPLRGMISVAVDEGTITEIYGEPLFYYSVEEMIEQLGEPASIYYVPQRYSSNKNACTTYPNKEDLGRYIRSSGFVIWYPDQAMVFFAEAPAADGGLVCPDMRIIYFCYYVPRPIKETLRDDWLADQCGIEALRGVTTTDLVEWHGFGSGY
jgi:hypothetical protein